MSQDVFVSNGSTVNLTPSAVSQEVQIPSPPTGENYRPTVRIRNTSAVEVFIAFGATSAVTATTASGIPIAPNSVETLGVPDIVNEAGTTAPFATIFVAVIAASAGATPIYFTPGLGL